MKLSVARQLLLLSFTFFLNNTMAEVQSLTIYLIRHAEKQAGPNPELTEKGERRANFYRDHWQDLTFSHIFSTDYKRTQATVLPLAELKKMAVESYNPRELPAFAEQLKKMNGQIVVAGHSNTTPQLAGLLGVRAELMSEKEYDRFYRITFSEGKLVDWGILRSFPR